MFASARLMWFAPYALSFSSSRSRRFPFACIVQPGEASSDVVVQEPFATAPTSPAAPAAVSSPAQTPAALSMSFYDVTAGNAGEKTNEAVDAGEEQPSREDEAPEEVEAAGENEKAAAEKKPDKPSLAETPESETLPQPTADAAEYADAAETAVPVAPDDVNTAKIDGCTTPPPPAHDSEGSDTHSTDDHGSPQREKPRTAAGGAKRDVGVAPTRSSRLLAFRSFSWDKKAKAPVEAAPRAEARVPSPGEHRPPAHGKARVEGDEHKEKGKERRKRFWK